VEAWTDERLDDLAATLRPLPAQMARNTEAIERLTDEVRSMRTDLSGLQRQIAQIGWGLSAALVGTMIALIVAAV
jgi:hypothetical protein